MVVKNILKKEILQEIDRVSPAEHREIMNLVINHLFEFKNIKRIEFDDVKNLSFKEYSDTDILLSLQKLCLLKNPVLNMKYELFDGYNNFIIDKSEMKEAERVGFLTHPITKISLPLNICNKKIFISFEVLNNY